MAAAAGFGNNVFFHVEAKMLKTRYTLLSFFRIFSVSSLMFVSLFIFIRIVDDLSYAIRTGKPFALLPYVYDLPGIFVEISPVITFLAAMFLLAEMLKHGELKILEVSGINHMKIFCLLCVCGIAISAFSFYMKNFAVPYAAGKKGKVSESGMIHFSSPEYLLYSEKFIPPDTFKKISFSQTPEGKDTRIIKAETAKYEGDNRWTFTGGTVWIFDAAGNLGESENFTKRTYNIELQPETVASAAQNAEELSFYDLKKLAAGMKKLNIFSPRVRSYLHEKIAYPLLNLFLLFLLIPFFSVRRKFSRVFVLSSSVILAFVAYGIYAFGFGLAVSGKAPPFLGVWMLHIITAASLAVYLRR